MVFQLVLRCRSQAQAAPKQQHGSNGQLHKVKAGARAQTEGPETPPQDEAHQVQVCSSQLVASVHSPHKDCGPSMPCTSMVQMPSHVPNYL